MAFNRLSDEDIKEALGELGGWKVEERGGKKVLFKEYKFVGFALTDKFKKVAQSVAAKLKHHPEIEVLDRYTLRVTTTTAVLGGISRRDTRFAAKLEETYNKLGPEFRKAPKS